MCLNVANLQKQIFSMYTNCEAKICHVKITIHCKYMQNTCIVNYFVVLQKTHVLIKFVHVKYLRKRYLPCKICHIVPVHLSFTFDWILLLSKPPLSPTTSIRHQNSHQTVLASTSYVTSTKNLNFGVTNETLNPITKGKLLTNLRTNQPLSAGCIR